MNVSRTNHLLVFPSLLFLTGTRGALLLAFFSSLLVSKYLSGLSHTVLIHAHWSHQNRRNASVSYRYDSRKQAKCVFLARSRSTQPLLTALLNDDQLQSIMGFHSPLQSKCILPRWQHRRPQGTHGHSPVWRTWKPYQTNATAVWTARSAPRKGFACLFQQSPASSVYNYLQF